MVASATALDITLGGSLDLSLLESSGVELHNDDVDVGVLVSGVLIRLAVLFEGRDLRADVPTGLRVEADPGLMDQAIEHLLVTAAASTPPGKAVEVSVSRTGAETTVKVAIDTVIPAAQLARIREPLGTGNGGAGPWIRLALAAKISSCTGASCRRGATPSKGRGRGSSSPASARRSRCWSEPAWASPQRRNPCSSRSRTRSPRGGCGGRHAPATARRDRGGPAELEPAGGRRSGGHGRDHPGGDGDRPQLLQPNVPSATTSEHQDRKPKKADARERRERRERNRQAESAGISGGATGGTQASATTGGTGKPGDRTGGGTGDGGGSVTPAPSHRRRLRPPTTRARASPTTRRVTTRVTTRTRTGIRARAPRVTSHRQ